MIRLELHPLMSSPTRDWVMPFPTHGGSFVLRVTPLDGCTECEAPSWPYRCRCCGRDRIEVLAVCHSLDGELLCGRCSAVKLFADRRTHFEASATVH